MPCQWVAQGAKAMGVQLSEAQTQQIARYHALLTEANGVMNLTRVPDDAREAAERNYLDSLAPLQVPGLMDGVRTLIDVGAGAGCPGLLLSIALPETRVTLLDALQKRVKFLNEVIEALGLNARALHGRCEDAARDMALRAAFDCVTARAVADTPVLLELALPFARRGGMLVAYKGPAVEEELTRAARALSELGGRVRAVVQAPIPGRDWDHRLLIVDKVGKTPDRYPRKAGEPGRNPL